MTADNDTIMQEQAEFWQAHFGSLFDYVNEADPYILSRWILEVGNARLTEHREALVDEIASFP